MAYLLKAWWFSMGMLNNQMVYSPICSHDVGYPRNDLSLLIQLYCENSRFNCYHHHIPILKMFGLTIMLVNMNYILMKIHINMIHLRVKSISFSILMSCKDILDSSFSMGESELYSHHMISLMYADMYPWYQEPNQVPNGTVRSRVVSRGF